MRTPHGSSRKHDTPTKHTPRPMHTNKVIQVPVSLSRYYAFHCRDRLRRLFLRETKVHKPYPAGHLRDGAPATEVTSTTPITYATGPVYSHSFVLATSV